MKRENPLRNPELCAPILEHVTRVIPPFDSCVLFPCLTCVVLCPGKKKEGGSGRCRAACSWATMPRMRWIRRELRRYAEIGSQPASQPARQALREREYECVHAAEARVAVSSVDPSSFSHTSRCTAREFDARARFPPHPLSLTHRRRGTRKGPLTWRE